MIVITATERYITSSHLHDNGKDNVCINSNDQRWPRGWGGGGVGGKETQRNDLVERGSRAQEYPNI